jgi:Integrase core domain
MLTPGMFSQWYCSLTIRLPAQPCRPNGIHRFIYRADDHHESAVRIDRPGTRSSQSVHFNVTEHPTGAWTAQHIVEAFADREDARYLIRDRDSRYSAEVRLRIKSLGIEEILTAPQSPWQNPYAERLIGSIQRECLNQTSS